MFTTKFLFFKKICKFVFFVIFYKKEETQTFNTFVFETKNPVFLAQTTKYKDLNSTKIKNIYSIKLKKNEEKTFFSKNLPDVMWISPLKKKKICGRTYDVGLYNKHQKQNTDSIFYITDPLFPYQWHLYNRKIEGNDINVFPVWNSGNYGQGINVCIIDDGIEYEHRDIRENINLNCCYNFHEKNHMISPRKQEHRHGTRCAGQIVSNFNDLCGVGVAPKATILGVKILEKEISCVEEANALIHNKEKVDIYSCSWGPADDGKTVEGPDVVVLRSIIDGVLNGRTGLGSIYMFAVGNGKTLDNCNYDGYVNNVFTFGIGAIDIHNEIPVYMEECASNLVVTYSSNLNIGIATTDINGKCTLNHGGTSAAVPIASGIVSLLLCANNTLGWRDVLYILVDTACPFSLKKGNWRKNGNGKYFSHWFGFGKIDANITVQKAQDWKHVGPLLPKPQKTQYVYTKLPYTTEPVCFSYTVESWMVEDINFLEQVTVTLTVEHTKRGALSVELISPSGMVSRLATYRTKDNSKEGLDSWTFSSVAFWGEKSEGVWNLCIENLIEPKHSGQLVKWRLTFWGQTTQELLSEYLKHLDYHFILLFPYFPPSTKYFDLFSPYYHLKPKMEFLQTQPKVEKKTHFWGFLFFFGFVSLFCCYKIYKKVY